MTDKDHEHRHGEGCGCRPDFFTRMIDNAAVELSRRRFLKGAGALGGILAFAPLGSDLLAAPHEPPKDAKADAIYYGGTIITMRSEQERVEALAVHQGHILATGTRGEMEAFRSKETRLIDLKGKTLMPGFYDPHSHVSVQSLKFATANLDPKPIGKAGSITDIQNILRDYIGKHQVKPGDWVIGWGYDDTAIEEKRHPTRDDLDKVSTEHPILIVHISAHLAAYNSKALEVLGIDANTKDPKGGKIQRRPNSNEPNGVLEEFAWLQTLEHVPMPSAEETMDLFEEGMKRYAAAGITTAQDAATLPGTWELLTQMHKDGRMPIDVVTWPVFKSVDEATFERVVKQKRKPARVMIGGIKLMLDGSIQGYTAYLTKPYHVQPPGATVVGDKCDAEEAECLFVDKQVTKKVKEVIPEKHGHRGYSNMTAEQVKEWVARCDAHDIQIQAHTNGDAATDMLLDAIKAVRGGQPKKDLRTTIIHAQMMRDDQLEDAAKYGLTPSFFPIHVYYWGDRHRDIFLGPERAARIDPSRSALDRGLKVTLHHDAPVAGIDMLTVAWSAINRITSSGKPLGSQERISPYEAFRAITIDAAWQNFEEDRKGTLEKGKLADMVVLDADPLRIDPMKIRDIKVLETIKEGISVYRYEG